MRGGPSRVVSAHSRISSSSSRMTSRIRSSLASQERERVIAEGRGDGQRALVIGGAGNMSFRNQFEDGGIALSDTSDIIGTLDGGDVFMVGGNGGITTGTLGILNEDKTGDPGQIILATVNGGDISTGTLYR